jgi:hypothetical protein
LEQGAPVSVEPEPVTPTVDVSNVADGVPADRLRWGDGIEDEGDVQFMLCMYLAISFYVDGC